MNIESIRPSSDLRNHYGEISKLCRESARPVMITVNGREDTAILSFSAYQQMAAKLSLLEKLAEADEDIRNDRISSAGDVKKRIDQFLEKMDV